jgi:putative hydrolase of the HAD superfamily
VDDDARAIQGVLDLRVRVVPDGVGAAVDELAAAGVALGVISNFEEWLERLLEGLGIADYFDVRVISGIEGLEKPDPRIFRLALDRAGVPPERAAYVGDNPVLDIEPAARLGMFPVLIDRRNRYPGAAARITSMAELPERLAARAGGGAASAVPGRS